MLCKLFALWHMIDDLLVFGLAVGVFEAILELFWWFCLTSLLMPLNI